ncbi:unnamed protein product [Caenorhabditis angaria]|uniref:Uncharacterized protein n=1 Tax=Caenorhabditis angaria TaxID=860376 RepID=A0A9P1ILZ0_9PELO|nr:unnamed protein product [Caenorhabditis angaria]
MKIQIFLIFLNIFLVTKIETKINWRKSDLPQFRSKTTTEAPEITSDNRIVNWKNNLHFEKVKPSSNIFCRIWNLCAHYSYGTLLMNIVGKWRNDGFIWPYEKGGGKMKFPKNSVTNFVQKYHREHRNSPIPV